MANIWKEQNQAKETPNRNNFDLSFQNHLTMKMGTLYPVFCKPVVPTDSFQIDAAFGLKFMPLVFPVQSKMRAHMHFFYVRNKNLWKDFPDFISGLKTSNDGVEHPFIFQPSSFFRTGSLADYLGVPTTQVDAGVATRSVNLRLGNLFDREHSVPQWLYFPDVHYGENNSITGYALTLGGRPLAQFVNAAPSTSTYHSMWMLSQPLDFNHRVDFVKDPHVGFSVGVTDDSVFRSFTNFSVGVWDEPYQDYRRLEDIPIVEAQFDLTNKRFDLSSGNEGTLRMLTDYVNDCLANGRRVCLLLSGTYNNTSQGTIRNYVAYTNNLVPLDDAVFPVSYPASIEGVDDIGDQPTNVFSEDEDAGIKVSALPFRAYESCYNAYYRNTHGVDPFKINGVIECNKFNTTTEGGKDSTPYKLEQRNYELDFLTSALPSPQAGVAPLVGMSALGNITVEDENGITTAKAALDNDGNITKISVTSPLASVEHARTLMNMAAVGMSINDFRNVNALQRHLEQTLRSGYRYLDFIEGHFGKSPEYKELDMPEFIGGFSRDVTVSQILQTTDTDFIGEKGSPLGSYAGNANCFGGSESSITHYCDDYGFIIGILCVTPTPSYSQLLPKFFLHQDRLDYFFPEFSQIGMQPITYREVCPIQRFAEDEDSLDDTFGYQRPNYDLVASVDEVHGNFRTDMRDYLINRRFTYSPELSPDFIKIHPEETNDVFANRTPTDDTIIGQVVFQVHAKRPLPRVVIPALGR